MSVILRCLLIVASVVVSLWILHKIRKAKVKMEDAIFWIVFSALLLVLAIFPQISYRLCELLGILSPANFIFLVMICVLVEKIFTLSIVISQLEEKIAVLSAEVALRSHAQKTGEQKEESGKQQDGQA